MQNFTNAVKNLFHTTQYFIWYVKRGFGQVDRSIIQNYFTQYEEKKLHIGCGQNQPKDWLNCDLYPLANNIIHLNATEIFPFENEAFSYVFSEHMIEHIPYEGGAFMLKECCRVLKKGGKIRISTPNLQSFINLYTNDKTDLQNNYISWNTEQFIPTAPYPDDTFVINNYVRAWGHQFIYDEKTLRKAMEIAGFTNVVSRALNESENPVFIGLEKEEKMPAGFLKLESFTLEAVKA
jgi:predicted SAM-dependent methyltransferase